MATKKPSESTITVIKNSFRILSAPDRKKLKFITAIQAGLSILDLVGVALIGVLAAIAVNGISSREAGERTGQLLSVLNLDNSSIQTQVALLAAIASFFLIGKTIFTALLSRRIAYFLSAKGAYITSDMNRKVLSEDLELITGHSSMNLLYALTSGVQAITSGIVASVVVIVADVSMLLVIFAGLVLVDPLVAFMALILFGGIGYTLYLLQQKRALSLGLESADLHVKSSRLMVEELSAFREIFVRDKISHYERSVSESRRNLSQNIAEMSFLPSISKYIMEVSTVLCMMLISGVQFVRTDASHAVATLALFLAASSRFIPAVLRIQQSALTIQNSVGSAWPTLELYEKLSKVKPNLDTLNSTPTGFSENSIELRNVTFRYRDNNNFTLQNIDLEVKQGEFVAFVGPSGAGKSTLVDLLLGLLTPSAGTVTILGSSARAAIKKYPGLIGYVPQNVYLKHGSISENVALGYSVDEIDSVAVNRAL